MRKLNVGFTVQINDKDDSFWVNGIKQNAVTLQELFALCPNVGNSKLVNLGSLKDYKNTVWEPFAKDIIDFNECLNTLDVVVTATVSFTTNMIEQLAQKNVSIVKQIMGNEYAIFNEYMLFHDKDMNSYSKRKHHKAAWISPHFYEQNKDFFEVIIDNPAYIGPYVWSPRFIEEHAAGCSKTMNIEPHYVPRGEKEKMLSTFEPNINILKTCLTPIIITEKFYRKEPDLLKVMSIFGSNTLTKKKILVDFVKDLSVHQSKKMFFEARYPMAWSLFKHTDIVIAHQRDLALNYAYFDAAWLGFPVVHNSDMLQDLAFYYKDWDAEVASDLIVDIAKNFDSNYEQYRKDSREVISRFLPTNEDNINKYAELLENVA